MLNELVFNTGKQYLSEVGRKDVRDFCKAWPQPKVEYKKGNIKFRCFTIQLPIGAITSETEFIGEDPQDGTRNYTTPNAILKNHGLVKVVVRIINIDEGTEEMKVLSGTQVAALMKDAIPINTKIVDSENEQKAKKRLEVLKTIEKTAGATGSATFAAETMERAKAEIEIKTEPRRRGRPPKTE